MIHSTLSILYQAGSPAVLAPTPIETALFLVFVVNRFTAGAITPIFDKFKWDKFYLMYVSWVVGALVVFLADINLFAAYLPANVEIIGRLLTALLAGGGANILHDITDNQKPAPAAEAK